MILLTILAGVILIIVVFLFLLALYGVCGALEKGNELRTLRLKRLGVAEKELEKIMGKK